MDELQQALAAHARGAYTLDELRHLIGRLLHEGADSALLGQTLRLAKADRHLDAASTRDLLSYLEATRDGDEATVTHSFSPQTTQRTETSAPPIIAPPPAREEDGFGVGSVLNQRFVIEAVLGEGAMGVVYKARDLRREEALDSEPHVAIKVLSDSFQRHPDAFIALQREAKKAQMLAHPNIVTVYDFDRDGDRIYMTMALLEGEPLDRRLASGEPFSEEEALSCILQMSRALAYAHEQGIVHSDFKPGNVFLTRDGVVKVVDFGIARAIKRPDDAQSDATVFDAGSLGALTPAYASPEMLDHREADPADDVYALAVVSYLLLSGQHPFDRLPASNAKALKLEPAHDEAIPPRYRKILAKGLDFERRQRIPDAKGFLDAFEQIVDARRRRIWYLATALVLTLALGGMALFITLQPSSQPTSPALALEDTSQLPSEQQDRVQRLLDIARVHRMVGRLVDPPGSSALAALQQIREIHPHNRQAHEGLQRIADEMWEQARQALRNGDPAQAAILIDKGLEAMPEHPALLGLKKKLPPPSSAD